MSGGVSRQWQRVNSSSDLSSLIEGGSTQSVNEHPDHSYLASPSFAQKEISQQKAVSQKLVIVNKDRDEKQLQSPPHSPRPREREEQRGLRSNSNDRQSQGLSSYMDNHNNDGDYDSFSPSPRRSRRGAPSLTAQQSCSDFVRSNGEGSRSRNRCYSENYDNSGRPSSSSLSGLPPMPTDPLRRETSGGYRQKEQQQHPLTPPRSPPRSPVRSVKPGAFASSAPNSFDEVSAKLELDRQQSLGSSAYRRGSGESFGAGYDRPQYQHSSRGTGGGYDRQQQYHHHHSSSHRGGEGRRTPSPPLPVYYQHEKQHDHYYDSYSSSNSRHQPHHHHQPHRPTRNDDYDPEPRYSNNSHHPSHERHYEERNHRYPSSDRHRQQQQQQQEPVQTLEISPGVFARLRGAEETWQCVERDFYMPVNCIVCDLNLCCIQDADYVLCPACRVVSPMEGLCEDNGGHDGGVGLGFTFQDLQRWQMEILQKRDGKR